MIQSLRAHSSSILRDVRRLRWSTTVAIARTSCLLTIFLVTIAVANAQQQQTEKRLPSDNIAWFSPSDAMIEVQLNTIESDVSLAGADIRLISSDGETRDFVADQNGKAVLEDISEGLHAVLASKRTQQGELHSAIVVGIRSLGAATDAATDIFGLDFEVADQIRPLQMTMMNVKSDIVHTVMQNNLPTGERLLADRLNHNLAIKQLTSEAFEFKIQLGADGSLRGKLISLMDPRSRQSGLQGTNIIIFRNGAPVGKTVANAVGQFRIQGIQTGVHGLMAIGRGGYCAFAFNATDEEGLLTRDSSGRMFAISQLSNDGETIPVALIPPSMNQPVVDFVTTQREVKTEASEPDTSEATQIAATEAESLPKAETKIETDINRESARLVKRSEPVHLTEVKPGPLPTSQPAVAKANLRQPINPLRARTTRGKIPLNPLRTTVNH